MATDVISREAQQQYPRWPIASTRSIRVDLGPAGSGNIVDVSFGGIRVKTVAPLRREAELPLRIEVPDRSPVQCSGVVVWSKPNGSAGLKFTKLEDDQKTILGSWINELEQATSDSSPQKDEFARTTAQIAAMKLNNADALRLIARRIEHLVAASGVCIAIGKPENMSCVARVGEAPELGSAVRPNTGLVGECIRSRKLVVCHDVAADPRAAEFKQGSALFMPLLVSGEMRGLIQVFSAKALAFDAKCVDIVGKLADAAIYITHNVMPHRRIAAVTAMPISRPAVSSAPAVLKPSDSGKIKPFPARLVPPLMPPPPPVVKTQPPVASETEVPIATLAEPIQPRPVTTAVATKPAPVVDFGERFQATPPARLAASTPVSFYQPPVQSSKKWVVGVPLAAAILIAAPLGFYYWNHKPVTTVAAAAPTVNTAEIAPDSEPAPPAPTVKPASLRTTAPAAPAAEPKSSTAPPPLTKVSKISIGETVSRENKAAPVEAPKAAEPAPLMIASGVPVNRPRRVDVSDAAAPSVSQIGVQQSSMPGIAIPVSLATPKLIAPVAKIMTGGKLIQRISPIYPQTAIAGRIEGPVELHMVITRKGTVDKVVRISGHPMLAQAAIDAVKRWRYEPYKLDGQPVEQEMTVTLNFKIPQ